MNIKKGCVVKAIAGRDKNRFFIIIGVLDEQFSLIADGRSRLVEKPKKKKNKHLDYFAEGEPEMTEQMLKGEKITNAKLRKALAKYNISD